MSKHTRNTIKAAALAIPLALSMQAVPAQAMNACDQMRNTMSCEPQTLIDRLLSLAGSLFA